MYFVQFKARIWCTSTYVSYLAVVGRTLVLCGVVVVRHPFPTYVEVFRLCCWETRGGGREEGYVSATEKKRQGRRKYVFLNV